MNICQRCITMQKSVKAYLKPVFVDVRPDTLKIDENLIETAITERTKAIFVVHYAGVACEMDRIMSIAREHGLRVVEDAAQGVNAFYHDRALGSIADLILLLFWLCAPGGGCLRFDHAFQLLIDGLPVVV